MVVKGVADKEMEANKWSKQMEQTNGTWDGTPKSVRMRTRGVWRLASRWVSYVLYGRLHKVILILFFPISLFNTP